MWLIVDQSLAMAFISINTQQQRASLPVKPGILERKVYNNDNKTLFSVFRFAKPLYVMCCGLHCFSVWAATHDHTQAWQMLIHCVQKRMFYSLNTHIYKQVNCLYWKTLQSGPKVGVRVVNQGGLYLAKCGTCNSVYPDKTAPSGAG